MLALEEFKKALGSKANSLSEVEIERIRDIQDRFADVFFDSWIKRKNWLSISDGVPLKIPEKSGKMNE
jgi:hypothetical protein